MWHISVVLMILCVSCLGAQWNPIDWDATMHPEKYPTQIAATKQVFNIEGSVLYAFLKRTYENNKFGAFSAEPRIPKIIHQIWLGSPLPEELKAFKESWQAHHPGWRYILWTDELLQKVTLHNQKLFDEATNYGQKADIARYEILYHFGGVYADMDEECLQSVEDLHHLFDFYCGVQPLDCGFVQLSLGVIGCKKGHPIVKHVILSIAQHADQAKGVPAKTGPIPFTRSFVAQAGKQGTMDIVLPAHYFTPLGAFAKVYEPELWLGQGAFGVHHWAKTWMPKQYRAPKFRGINNYDSTVDWNA